MTTVSTDNPFEGRPENAINSATACLMIAAFEFWYRRLDADTIRVLSLVLCVHDHFVRIPGSDLLAQAERVGYIGNVHSGRDKMVRALEASTLPRGLWRTAKGDLRQTSDDTVFGLAPRRHGRFSYRLYELLQIGIPIMYPYDDMPWLPADINNDRQSFIVLSRLTTLILLVFK